MCASSSNNASKLGLWLSGVLAARTHVPVERLAHTRLVKVVAVRVNAEEADEGEQLRHAVLERRA